MATTNWSYVSFGQICLHSAFGPRFSSREYSDGGSIACLRTKDISLNGVITLSTMPRADLDPDKFSDHFLHSEDLVITRSGRVGTVAVFQNFSLPVVPGAFLIRFRLDRKIADPWFYRYYFNSPIGQQSIQSIASGSVQQNINITNLNRLKVPLPDIHTQKAIAKILGTLDDKIEINRRMNETLESIARAIFKSWFVDFDPVRAKLEGQSHERQSSTSAYPMPAEVYDLFPSAFQDSELGKIPQGWDVRSAEEVADIGIGKTPPRKQKEWFTKNKSDLPWISIRDLGACDVYISKVKEYLTEEAVQKFNVRKIPDNTVVVSFKLTVGRVAITDGQMLSNEAIAHYKPKPSEQELPPEYLYFYLQQFDYRSLGSTSSIATAVNSKLMKAIPVLVPSSKLNKCYQNVVGPLFTRIKLNQKESETLAQLRDTLLPKLLSGELTVPDALLQAEEVL